MEKRELVGGNGSGSLCSYEHLVWFVLELQKAGLGHGLPSINQPASLHFLQRFNWRYSLVPIYCRVVPEDIISRFCLSTSLSEPHILQGRVLLIDVLEFMKDLSRKS